MGALQKLIAQMLARLRDINTSQRVALLLGGALVAVSLIWLILPSMFFALLLLAILGGLVFAVSYVFRIIPPYALVVQLYFEQAKSKIGQLLNMSAEPFLRINSLWAAIRYASERGRKPTQE